MKEYCRLSGLPLNESATVYDIVTDTPITKRMKSFGIEAGTIITPVFKSPFGEPTAYYLMDALVALRKSESDLIIVMRG